MAGQKEYLFGFSTRLRLFGGRIDLPSQTEIDSAQQQPSNRYWLPQHFTLMFFTVYETTFRKSPPHDPQ